MGTRTSWPARDKRAALGRDLRILVARGLSVRQASDRLGLSLGTAYDYLGRRDYAR